MATGSTALVRLRARLAGSVASAASAAAGATASRLGALRPGAAVPAAGCLSEAWRRARAGAGLRGMGFQVSRRPPNVVRACASRKRGSGNVSR